MSLRIIGGILVILGATGAGILKTRQFYNRVTLLNELERGMELIRCQMNYTLYPIPKLLEMTGKELKGKAGTYFIQLSRAIEAGIPRHRACVAALEQTGELSLPNDGLMALMEWSSELGQFDPQGENSMMKLSIERIRQAGKQYCEEEKDMVKSYTLLGVSAGISLVILML